MLEKYDPGLITGTIGAVIGIMLASIFEKSKIVHRFSKLRKNLKAEVEDLKQKLYFATNGRVFDNMQDLVQEGSEMVSEQRVDVPPWYRVIRRYRESNEMAQLISKIETEKCILRQTFYLQQILISHQQQISHIEETSSLLERANQEETSHLLQTLISHQEQTSSLPAQPNQAVAQTDTAEEMTRVGNSNDGHPSKLPVLIKFWNVFHVTSQFVTTWLKCYPYLTVKLASDGQFNRQIPSLEMTKEEKPMRAALRRRVGMV